MLSKCWEEAAREGEGAAGLACTRLSTGDSAIHRSRHSEAENRGLNPVKAAQVTDCYSPQLFLSLRLLAMAVRRLAVERRCHSSCGLLQGRRLLAVKGSVPALGAVLSDSEDVAVALVGRTGEEKGGESR